MIRSLVVVVQQLARYPSFQFTQHETRGTAQLVRRRGADVCGFALLPLATISFTSERSVELVLGRKTDPVQEISVFRNIWASCPCPPLCSELADLSHGTNEQSPDATDIKNPFDNSQLRFTASPTSISAFRRRPPASCPPPPARPQSQQKMGLLDSELLKMEGVVWRHPTAHKAWVEAEKLKAEERKRVAAAKKAEAAKEKEVSKIVRRQLKETGRLEDLTMGEKRLKELRREVEALELKAKGLVSTLSLGRGGRS